MGLNTGVLDLPAVDTQPVNGTRRAERAWPPKGTLTAALPLVTSQPRKGELSLIGEAQMTLGAHAVLKLNCGFGLTGKAEDLAPEVGVIFSF